MIVGVDGCGVGVLVGVLVGVGVFVTVGVQVGVRVTVGGIGVGVSGMTGAPHSQEQVH